MNLTDENIREFQMIYQNNFGKAISKEEAMEKGIRLIRLMEIALKFETGKSQSRTTITNNFNYYESNKLS